MRISLLSVALLAAGMTAPVHAQQIRAADTGAVGLVLEGIDANGEVRVRKGDVLWVEGFRPNKVKVLVDSVENRIRPNTPGVAAGTTLIGVTIESGTAYCPAIDYDATNRKVQCFQDLDDDGQFDGGYYTDQRGVDTQFLSGWLRGLSGLSPKIAYTDASEDTVIPTGKLTVQYDRMSKGNPQFWLYVEKEKADSRATCETTEPGTCTLLGRTFDYAENDDGSLSFTSSSDAAERYFTFYSVSSYRD